VPRRDGTVIGGNAPGNREQRDECNWIFENGHIGNNSGRPIPNLPLRLKESTCFGTWERRTAQELFARNMQFLLPHPKLTRNQARKSLPGFFVMPSKSAEQLSTTIKE